MSILKSTYSGSQKLITEEWLLNHGWYYAWSFSFGDSPTNADKSHIRRSQIYDNEQLQIVKTEQEKRFSIVKRIVAYFQQKNIAFISTYIQRPSWIWTN